MSSRLHPYSSQSLSQKPTAQIKKPDGKKLEKQTVQKPKLNTNENISANYELRTYLEQPSTSRNINTNVYPTLVQDTKKTELKSILKNKTNLPTNSKQTDPLKWMKENPSINKTKAQTALNKDKEENDLRIFSGTTRTIKLVTDLFAKNASNKMNKKPKVGPYLFEIFAQLDSTVSLIEAENKCVFTIKDNDDRMKCTFVEMDRKIDKIPRGSFIRCVGKYSLDKSEFTCFSVRVATQNELLNSGHYVSQSSSYIKLKFC